MSTPFIPGIRLYTMRKKINDNTGLKFKSSPHTITGEYHDTGDYIIVSPGDFGCSNTYPEPEEESKKPDTIFQKRHGKGKPTRELRKQWRKDNRRKF